MSEPAQKTALRLTLENLIGEQSEGEWDDATISKDADKFVDVLWPMMAPEKPAPADADEYFLKAIHGATPNGEWIAVKHHPNGDWSVAADPLQEGLTERYREAIAEVMKWRVGELPDKGYIRDNDHSRAAIAKLVTLSTAQGEGV